MNHSTIVSAAALIASTQADGAGLAWSLFAVGVFFALAGYAGRTATLPVRGTVN